MTTLQTGDLHCGFTPGMGFGFGWAVIKEPQGVHAMLGRGRTATAGRSARRAGSIPKQDLFVILLIQRTGLPNADGSELRHELQRLAVEAIEVTAYARSTSRCFHCSCRYKCRAFEAVPWLSPAMPAWLRLVHDRPGRHCLCPADVHHAHARHHHARGGGRADGTGHPRARQALAGMSNKGVLSVGVLFVVAAGMQETGGINWVATQLFGRPKTVLAGIARLVFPTMGLSRVHRTTRRWWRCCCRRSMILPGGSGFPPRS